MTTKFPNQPIQPEYPIYTIRFLAVHTLGVPVVWFLGAIASMQFVTRDAQLPGYVGFLGIDQRVSLVLLPLIISVVWNVINFGKPTIQEIRKILSR